jgi:hypothetical protein
MADQLDRGDLATSLRYLFMNTDACLDLVAESGVPMATIAPNLIQYDHLSATEINIMYHDPEFMTTGFKKWEDFLIKENFVHQETAAEGDVYKVRH